MTPDCDGRSDGRSDGQTESIMAKTALCIASYADALSKMCMVAAFDTDQCRPRLCVNTDVFYYILPLLDILAPSMFICGNVIITSRTIFSLPLQFRRSDEMLPFRLGTGNCSIW